MTSTYLYWITRLDTFLTFNEMFNILSGILIIIGMIAWCISCSIKNENQEYNRDDHVDSDWKAADVFQKTIKLPWKIAVLVFFLTSALAIFIPTTKEMVAIDIIPKICSNEQLKDISKDALDIAQSWLKEMKENVKKTN